MGKKVHALFSPNWKKILRGPDFQSGPPQIKNRIVLYILTGAPIENRDPGGFFS